MKKILLIALALRIFLSLGPYHPDLGNHLDWGIKVWEVGFNKFYENLFWQVSWPNQPPGTMYLFAFVRKIYELIFGFFWYLNIKIPLFPSVFIPFLKDKLYVSLVKMPFVLADIGMAVLVYKFVSLFKSEKLGKIALAVFLFNPVIWYNSSVWGQTDSLVNFFSLWAFYLFLQKRPVWGWFVYTASLYFKGSLLILLPVFLLLLVKSDVKWWKKAIVLVFPPLFFAYLSFPFVRWMSPSPWLYHLYKDRVFGHQGNMLTANAFNIWAFFFGVDFSKTDQGYFAGFTYKTVGMILFGLCGIISFIGLYLKKMKTEAFLWALTLISFSAFCFLTNMHERYSYPIFPYLTILIFLFPRLWLVYILLSLVSLLNLYHLWYVSDMPWLKSVYTPLFIKTLSFSNILILAVLFFLFFSTFQERKRYN